MKVNEIEHKALIKCKNLKEYFELKKEIEKSENDNGGFTANDHISIKNFLVKILNDVTIEDLEENDVIDNIAYFFSLEKIIEKRIIEDIVKKNEEDEIKIKIEDKVYEQYFVKGRVAEIYFDIRNKVNKNEGNILDDYKIAREFLTTLFDNQFKINELENADAIEVMSNFYSLYNKISKKIIEKIGEYIEKK